MVEESFVSEYQKEILLGMNRLNKHVYEGTVTSKVKKARRAADKIAKASRKMNRPA